MNIYGYARISRKSQSIDRQIRNIKAAYPDAAIAEEAFTGTKIQGRKALDKVLKAVKPGDVIVFDSASRMSRNADEAVTLYEELFSRGVSLVFLKEPQINTDVYRAALDRKIEFAADTGNAATDNLITGLADVLNRYTIDLAKEQVRIVFDQAQKEVEDLHQRTAEGIQTARLEGKQIGHEKGVKMITQKSREAKEKIRRYSADFDGTLSDPEVIKLTGISRNSYYKYKREMREAIAC